MAQKIQTFFIDDLDGSEAEGTVLFGLDGTQYEMGAALLEWGRARGYSALWCFLPGLPVSVRA